MLLIPGYPMSFSPLTVRLLISMVVPGKSFLRNFDNKRKKVKWNETPNLKTVTATQSYNASIFPSPFEKRSSIIPHEHQSRASRQLWPKPSVFRTPMRTWKQKLKPKNKKLRMLNALAPNQINPRNPKTRIRPNIRRKWLCRLSHSSRLRTIPRAMVCRSHYSRR